MKRILYIAYHFPPQGGAGVQRSAKFVKYLPLFGVEPTVLTSPGPTDNAWSPADASLASDIPSNRAVFRTPWPDTRLDDSEWAEKERFDLALQLIAQRRLEAIFVSMSPFSDAAFAARLSARCGIPWVADLRDPWALDEFQVYRTRWHRLRTRRAMRSALQTAARIIMNTPEAAAALRQAFPELATRTFSITNGFDAEDLPADGAREPNDRFTLVHAGFLHTGAGLRQRRHAWQYRLLGRMEPDVEILPRSHYYLLQALALWLKQEPSVAKQLRLVLVGELRPIDRECVENSPVAGITEYAGYLPHQASVAAVAQADLLFLPMHKLPPGRRARLVPGKAYEYLASGRPILAPVPAGDARDFLVRAGTGLVCEPDDVPAMLIHLKQCHQAWLRGEAGPAVDREYLKHFERKQLTRQLAGHLHDLLETPMPELLPA